MYEIKSCGVTIDMTDDHFVAAGIYNRCVGPHVQMFKYTPDGRSKEIVAQRYSYHSTVTRN